MPRIQIDVSEQKRKDLEKLVQECGLSTMKELFNNALTLFEWAINERKKGNIIASINESDQKYRELHMPVLNDVRRARAAAE